MSNKHRNRNRKPMEYQYRSEIEYPIKQLTKEKMKEKSRSKILGIALYCLIDILAVIVGFMISQYLYSLIK